MFKINWPLSVISRSNTSHFLLTNFVWHLLITTRHIFGITFSNSLIGLEIHIKKCDELGRNFDVSGKFLSQSFGPLKNTRYDVNFEHCSPKKFLS